MSQDSNLYRITPSDLFDLISYTWDKSNKHDVIEKAIDIWYPSLNGWSRSSIYNWALKFLEVTNEKQARFMARYNPDNQYMVALNNDKTEEMYLFNSKYYKSGGWYASEDSIVNIERVNN